MSNKISDSYLDNLKSVKQSHLNIENVRTKLPTLGNSELAE